MAPILKKHYHHCPSCYEVWECELFCTIEYDLEEGDQEFGAYCNCPECDVNKYKDFPQLNQMLKGWERIFRDNNDFQYLGSDGTHHDLFLPGTKRFVAIQSGDFDLDFEKYNGFK